MLAHAPGGIEAVEQRLRHSQRPLTARDWLDATLVAFAA
jgi:hypothetical protein